MPISYRHRPLNGSSFFQADTSNNANNYRPVINNVSVSGGGTTSSGGGSSSNSSVANFSSGNISGVTINDSTINNSPIGLSGASSGNFTSLTTNLLNTGNLRFSASQITNNSSVPITIISPSGVNITDLNVTGTLGFSGSLGLSSLSVTGNSTLNNLTSTGTGTFNNLTVNGTFGFSGALSGLSSLSVTGNTSIGGTLGVTGLGTFGNLTSTGLGTFNNLTVNGTFGFSGALSGLSSLSVTGNTSIGGTLGVTGLTTLGNVNSTGLGTFNDLTVNGTFGFSGALSGLTSLSVTGNTSIGGTLGVTGLGTFNDLTVNGTFGFSGALTGLTSLSVTGNTSIGGTLGVTGLGTFGNLTSTGTGTFNDLTVNGTFGFSGALSGLTSLSVTGNTSVGGTLGVTGLATFNSLTTGSITVTGTSNLNNILSNGTSFMFNNSSNFQIGQGPINSYFSFQNQGPRNIFKMYPNTMDAPSYSMNGTLELRTQAYSLGSVPIQGFMFEGESCAIAGENIGIIFNNKFKNYIGIGSVGRSLQYSHPATEDDLEVYGCSFTNHSRVLALDPVLAVDNNVVIQGKMFIDKSGNYENFSKDDEFSICIGQGICMRTEEEYFASTEIYHEGVLVYNQETNIETCIENYNTQRIEKKINDDVYLEIGQNYCYFRKIVSNPNSNFQLTRYNSSGHYDVSTMFGGSSFLENFIIFEIITFLDESIFIKGFVNIPGGVDTEIELDVGESIRFFYANGNLYLLKPKDVSSIVLDSTQYPGYIL